MLKKRLYTALNILMCCLCSEGLRAQVTFNLTETAINAQTDLSQVGVASGQFSGFTVFGSWEIWVKSNTTTIPVTSGTSGTFLNLNVARVKLNRVESLNLGGAKPEITLSTTDQSIAQAVLLASAGAMYIDYRLVVPGTAWQAGTYSTTLSFIPCDATVRYYTVVVDPYITVAAAPATTTALNVTSLADFRTNGVSATQTFGYRTSVPTDIMLKVGPSPITFNNTGYPQGANPTLIASALSSAAAGIPAAAQFDLSTTNQALSASSGIPVQVGNSSGTITNTLKVSPASLRANFVQAGTYTYPLTYTISKTSAAQPAVLAEKTMTTTATVNVPRLFEATIPSTGIDFTFNTSADYASGKTVPAPSPILISSTTPYNVTVRASSDFTRSGSTIPAGVITVEGIPSQTGVSSLTLSTSAQTLISSSVPIIDRAVYLQYRIPSTQTSNLLNKTAGQYSADIIYTVTAP